ncbi:MAG: MarR family winged helix-turn-helix transcriptional regulator [Acidimicrobiales bacterium]
MTPDPLIVIEDALLELGRTNSDRRGYHAILRRAGIDIERSGIVLLHRLRELGPSRMSRLAEVIGVDISTASRSVGRLVAAGYVERRPDPSDGRASLHSLSDKGEDACRRIQTARREWLVDVLAGFSAAEQADLARLLTRLVGKMASASD